ncbi:MAG: NAD(P)/FAD-dependent oxidoreductase [Parashewanella sp.]
MQDYDVVIIGAGAAGLMCGATAGYRGRSVLVLDHAKQAGKKILISGGGRCNFTNENAQPNNYLCENPHFVKSALARYSAQDFIELVERHCIEYHHKTLGQLFCNESAKDIVKMLLTECEWAGTKVQLRTEIIKLSREKNGLYQIQTSQGDYRCQSLVIATGGLSMPKLGATPFGYKIAEQFGLNVLPTKAGLVPFTWHQEDKQRFEPLAGVSVPTRITAKDGTQFTEAMLFTHRGLSGPAILQISNFWQAGEAIEIDLLPDVDLFEALAAITRKHPKQSLKNTLIKWLPKRLIEVLFDDALLIKQLNQLDHPMRNKLVADLKHWQLVMNGTEGYRTAEVTLGGVDTNELSSKTFEAKKSKGLFFIGEVIDVTGWLGGYNFQFSWASGVACGESC